MKKKRTIAVDEEVYTKLLSIKVTLGKGGKIPTFNEVIEYLMGGKNGKKKK